MLAQYYIANVNSPLVSQVSYVQIKDVSRFTPDAYDACACTFGGSYAFAAPLFTTIVHMARLLTF